MNAELETSSIIESVYEAALDPSAWSQVMNQVGEVLRGPGIFLDVNDAKADVFEYVGFEDHYVRQYADHFAAINPWLPRIRSPKNLTLVTGRDLLTQDEYEATEFYNDWMKPQGQYEMIGGLLIKNQNVFTNISFTRPETEGVWTQQELRFYSAIMRHIRRAVQVHRQLHSAHLQRDASWSAMDHLPIGIILVTGDRKVIYANTLADRDLRKGDILKIQNDKLIASDSKNTGVLLKHLQDAIATSMNRGAAGGTSFQLQNGDHQRILLTCPVTPRSPVSLGEPLVMILMNAEAPPHLTTGRTVSYLHEVFGLTPAEARLTAALCSGEALKAYARKAGISDQTARVHLRHVYEKCGVKRQSELVSRVMKDWLILFSQQE